MKKPVILALTLISTSLQAQTYTQLQWGVNKGVNPYQFGANINGTWSNLGTVSSAGVWTIPGTNISGVPLLAANNTFTGTNTFTKNVSILYPIVSTPTFAASNEALRVLSNRSGDATGFTARLVDILDYDKVKSDTSTGVVDSLFVNHDFSGTTNPAGGRRAINADLYNSAPTTSNGVGNYIALEGVAIAKYDDGGTVGNESGVFIASAGIALLESAATNIAGVAGGEFDVAMAAGSSSRIKNGINVISGDGTPGGRDKEHGIYADAGVMITGATTGDVGWNLGISFGQSAAGWPITSTGTIIGTGATGNARTAANGIDFTAVTFSGNAIATPGFRVDGFGNTRITRAFPNYSLNDTNATVTTGGLVRYAGNGSGSYIYQINTAAGGDFTSSINAYSIASTGATTFPISLSSPSYILTGSTSGATTLTTNPTTASYTLQLPAAAPGGTGYALVANASGVASWVNPTTFPAGTLIVGTTLTSGGAAGQLMYDSGGLLQESANLVFASNTLTIGKATSATGALALGGATSGTVTVTPQAAAGTYNFNLPTSAGTSGQPLLSGGGGASAMTFGTLGVGAGGTNCSVASITCFNNITGFTAAGTTGTTSTNLVFSTSPTLVSPVLGAATGTSLALGGATLGTNALAVTGTTSLSSTLTSAGHIITAATANALTVGLNGATNPAFNIDASTASSATGINIKSAAATGGVALSAISSGTNENMTINSKGAGTLTLQSSATGAIVNNAQTRFVAPNSWVFNSSGATAGYSTWDIYQTNSGTGALNFRATNDAFSAATTIMTFTRVTDYTQPYVNFLVPFTTGTTSPTIACTGGTTTGASVATGSSTNGGQFTTAGPNNTACTVTFASKNGFVNRSFCTVSPAGSTAAAITTWWVTNTATTFVLNHATSLGTNTVWNYVCMGN
jgi:hypothetical protein